MKILNTQSVVTAVALMCLAASFLWTQDSLNSNAPPSAPKAKREALQVTTISASPKRYQTTVTGYGQVTPAQALTLSAEVSGKVIELSPNLKSGLRVSAGDLLLKLDDTLYQEAVASAQSVLAAAQVTLMQQQLNQQQAKAEWQRSGLTGHPDSELALFAPQVKAAQAAVEHARSTLRKARAQLKKTRITAPFNALVINKSVELGSYVQPGSALTELYGTDQVEIALPLSHNDWRNLPDFSASEAPQKVLLTDTQSDQQWHGYIDRVAQNIDTITRQRAVIVRADHPLDQASPLYPGTFVNAMLAGKQMDNLLQLPVSALTQNSEIWYVDNSDMLQKIAVTVLFRTDQHIYLPSKPALQQVPIVAHPLNSYLPGMWVRTVSIAPQLADQATPNNRTLTP